MWEILGTSVCDVEFTKCLMSVLWLLRLVREQKSRFRAATVPRVVILELFEAKRQTYFSLTLHLSISLSIFLSIYSINNLLHFTNRHFHSLFHFQSFLFEKLFVWSSKRKKCTKKSKQKQLKYFIRKEKRGKKQYWEWRQNIVNVRSPAAKTVDVALCAPPKKEQPERGRRKEDNTG